MCAGVGEMYAAEYRCVFLNSSFPSSQPSTPRLLKGIMAIGTILIFPVTINSWLI